MPHAGHQEIEIKLRVANIPALLEGLRRFGACPQGRVFERNTLYDTPSADLRRSGRLLRLRTETSAASRLIPAGRAQALLTFKAPGASPEIGCFKQRLESELAVPNPRRWPQLLRSIGFRPVFRYEKYRSTFRLPNLVLDLDETPIGTFLELEGTAKAIDRAARALAFSRQDYLRVTYWDLYVAHCRLRGREPKNMVFPA